MSAAPPAAGKGGASLVSVAKLVMESAMKAGVPIDNKAAHNYAKQLSKMQNQAKKKGGSLGQVHYSVSKFMASHTAKRSNSNPATASEGSTAAAAAIPSAAAFSSPSASPPLGAAAAIKPAGGAYGRTSLQNVIANELLKSKAATAVASSASTATASQEGSGSSVSGDVSLAAFVATKPKPKVSLRRLVSAAYMPNHLKPAEEGGQEGSSSSSSPATAAAEAAKNAAIKDALGLGLDLTPTRRPETRLSDSAKARSATPTRFPAYTGPRSKNNNAQQDANKDATISLSAFLSKHIREDGKDATTTSAEATHDDFDAASAQPSKQKRAPSTDKEKAEAILAENPSAMTLGVNLAPTAPKKRTTLGALSATLAAAAAARQKLLEEQRVEQLRLKQQQTPTTATTQTTAAAEMPTAAVAATKKSTAMSPLGAQSPAATVDTAAAPVMAEHKLQDLSSKPTESSSLSAGFSLSTDDSPLFGDEQEVADRKARQEAAEKKQKEAAAAAARAAEMIASSSPSLSYTIPTAAPIDIPSATTPQTYAIPKPYVDTTTTSSAASAEEKQRKEEAFRVVSAETSAAEWEAQRAKEMEALRRAQQEEDERLKNLEVEKHHAALGEEWVMKQQELANKLIRDAATGRAKTPAALTADFYHKYREELYFLRDTEALSKAHSFDPITYEPLDSDGHVIPKRPDWELALEVFEKAAAAATTTNPVPTYIHRLVTRKLKGAPSDKRVRIRKLLADASVSNKTIVPLLAIDEMARLRLSSNPEDVRLFLDKFNAIPKDRLYATVPRSVHVAAMLKELELSNDFIENGWNKALATIDAYHAARGPQQGYFERALLRFYATRIPKAMPGFNTDIRKHLADVINARFEAMKKEPKSRGGTYADELTQAVTTTIRPQSRDENGNVKKASHQLNPDGTAVDEVTSVTKSYTLPVAIGGGAGNDMRNKLWLSLVQRGGAGRLALQNLLQSMQQSSLVGQTNEEMIYTYLLSRTKAEEYEAMLAEMERNGIDLNAMPVLAVRVGRCETAEEANQILEEADIKGAFSLGPSRTVIAAVCRVLNAADFEHPELLKRLKQWREEFPQCVSKRLRSHILVGDFIQNNHDEVVKSVLHTAAQSMKTRIAGGIPLDPTAPADSKVNSITTVPDLDNPDRDPLETKGLVINVHTVGNLRYTLLNSSLTRLGRKAIDSADAAQFQFVNKETRDRLTEEAKANGSFYDKISGRKISNLGSNTATLLADANSLRGASSSSSGGKEAEIEMPYTDQLLQYAKERNWSAAVALVPQFPTRVPTHQVGALTLVYNCVLSAAVEMPDIVGNVLSEMKKTNAVPNATTFNTVMSAFARSDDKWRDALEIFNTMPANVKDASTYSVALGIMTKHALPAEAFAAYEELLKTLGPKPSPILFGLAIQAVHKDSWEQCLQIFKDFVKAHGAAVAGKEIVVGRVKKSLELNNRAEELLLVDKLLTAPAAGGKGDKKQKKQQQQQGGNNNNNNAKNFNNNNNNQRPSLPGQPSFTKQDNNLNAGAQNSQPSLLNNNNTSNNATPKPISIADDDF